MNLLHQILKIREPKIFSAIGERDSKRLLGPNQHEQLFATGDGGVEKISA